MQTLTWTRLAACLLMLTWYANAQNVSRTQLELCFDGQLKVNSLGVTIEEGLSVPRELLSSQKVNPIITREPGRSIWYSFTELGVLVKRQDSTKDDAINLLLPQVPESPFADIKFDGCFKCGSLNIDFKDKSLCTRAAIRKAIKMLTKVEKKEEADCIRFYVGSSSAYLFFDQSDQLSLITLTLRVPKAK